MAKAGDGAGHAPGFGKKRRCKEVKSYRSFAGHVGKFAAFKVSPSGRTQRGNMLCAGKKSERGNTGVGQIEPAGVIDRTIVEMANKTSAAGVEGSGGGGEREQGGRTVSVVG